MIFLRKFMYRRFIYRWWMIFTIVVTTIFGSVLIIYEDWQVSRDNLSGLLPHANVQFYIHFSQSDDDWLKFPLFNNLANNFFPQFINQADIILGQESIEEAAYAVLQTNDGLVDGWLILSVNDQPINLPDYWHGDNFLSVQVVSSHPEFINQVQGSYFTESDNLRKYFLQKGVARSLTDYIFISLPEDKVFDNFIDDRYALSWPGGNWLIAHNQDRIEIRDLNNRSSFTPFSFGFIKPFWLQVFLGENVIGRELEKDLLIKLIDHKKMPAYFYDYMISLESKYQIKIIDLLNSLESPVDLVVSSVIDDNGKVKVNWVIKTEISNSGWQSVEKILATSIAYNNPRVEQVILPDGSSASELKPNYKPVEYQQIELDDRLVNIVYLSSEIYFAWFEVGGQKIMGNSLIMINNYLNAADNVDLPGCLKKSGGSFVVNFTREESEKLNLSQLIFTGLESKANNQEMVICYK